MGIGVPAAAVAAAGAAQLLNQLLKLLALAGSDEFELRASARLLTGELRNLLLARIGLLIAGGIVLPLLHAPVAGLRPGARRRDSLALSVLRLRGAEERGLHLHRAEGGMNLKRLAGLDILSEKYAYGHDAEFGYVAESRVADRWVPTTCGYCSVGCGMLVGVKDGRAVAARGDERHPVNRGKLCPKGLSEHHTLAGQGPRPISAAAQERQAGARLVGRGART